MSTGYPHKKVRVHYTGTLSDGSEFDSSRAGTPMELTIGAGDVLPAFEEAVAGMAVGESKTITVPAGKAHGPHSPELVREVARSRIPGVEQVEVGTRIQGSVSSGYPVYLKVLGISEETVTVDMNHPLAGQNLTYEITLIEIICR